MKWYYVWGEDGMECTNDPSPDSFVAYSDHIAAMAECERLAKKCYLDQSDSYWKIEYDRIMRDYGHLFMGII